MKVKWITKLPEIEGIYWFYGYLFGKYFGAERNDPEWTIFKVCKCSNGFLYAAKGHFINISDIEEGHYAPFELPEFPELKP